MPTGDQLFKELAGLPDLVSRTWCPSRPSRIRVTRSAALQPSSRRFAISQRAAHAPAADTPEVCPRATLRGGVAGLALDLRGRPAVSSREGLLGDLSRTSALRPLSDAEAADLVSSPSFHLGGRAGSDGLWWRRQSRLLSLLRLSLSLPLSLLSIWKGLEKRRETGCLVSYP